MIFACQENYVLTFVLIMLAICPATESMTFDEIIAGAAETVDALDFMDSEHSDTVKVELDMLFTTEQYGEMLALNASDVGGQWKRNAVKNTNYRWPGNTVPYMVTPGVFDGRDMHEIQAAMHDWSTYACVHFRQATPSDVNLIKYVNGNGCSSYVGKIGKQQEVTLSKGCRKKGVILHELGHALGFHHEQTRPDRDEYVEVLYQNIPDEKEFNFRKYSWSLIEDYGVGYDYGSVMHYGGKAFSSNGELTIKTRDSTYQSVIGNRESLSFRDIKIANKMLNCKPAACTLTDDQCPGEGFVNKNCQCACPGNSALSPVVICQPGGTNPGGGGLAPPTGGNSGGSTACTDLNPNCRLFGRTACHTHLSFMQLYCRATCGFCQAAAPAAPSCRDGQMTCASLATAGYCYNPVYVPFMQANCRLSCGLCAAAPAAPSCRDGQVTCASLATAGYCYNPVYVPFMQANCRLSCGLCVG